MGESVCLLLLCIFEYEMLEKFLGEENFLFKIEFTYKRITIMRGE